jgi:hypothetical protein
LHQVQVALQPALQPVALVAPYHLQVLKRLHRLHQVLHQVLLKTAIKTIQIAQIKQQLLLAVLSVVLVIKQKKNLGESQRGCGRRKEGRKKKN